jgi:predicted RNA-binding Zn-ribbon protein involved in translation (DUF1610 family)
MAAIQYIACPVCGSQIPFDPYALVRGESFSCPNCPDVAIGLSMESRDLVKKSLDEFENLKKKVMTTKPDEPDHFWSSGVKHDD